MGGDTKWIVGTGVGIVVAIFTPGVSLAALMIVILLNTGMNSRIDDVNGRIDARMESFDTRLRSVEVAFGKVDQRLLTIERFVLPTPGAQPPRAR